MEWKRGDYGYWSPRPDVDVSPHRHDQYIVFVVDRVNAIGVTSIVTAIGGTWHSHFPFSGVHLPLEDCHKLTKKEAMLYVL